MSQPEKDIMPPIRVDKDLIRMFLEMTPEQRITANNNAIRAIEELGYGFEITYQETLKLMGNKNRSR